uniref:Eukaryotic translation initiation factor 2A n=1 Tax=Araucaria cunninghamii TaxID=56994 RepID=A0A0D6QYY0_ARACU
MERSSPPLNYILRGPEGLSLLVGPPFTDGEPAVKLEKVPCTSAKFSDNGSKLLLITESGMNIYNCDSVTQICSVNVPGVIAAVISPRGNFLQTFRRPSNSQDKNLIIWDIQSGAAIYQLSQKSISKATWPSFQFSEDETIACRMATNEIHIFDTQNFSRGIVNKLRLPGIAGLQLATLPPTYLAAYVPESKGIPASVQIFERENLGQAPPVARRSFFRCSTVQLLWNHGSTGLLVVAQSDVDKSNQSYYGESRLHYLTTDGSHEGMVPLRKEGPVHDVQWSPSGSEFAVVYGFMPASATLFDKKCNPLLEFGTGPYNTLRWNPHGKLLCIAGFGNLPGDMAFWDCSAKTLLGSTRSEWSVTSEWSPDGQYFMTATTAPRLQIDNGIKIFSYNGSLYFKKLFDRLYQAEWRPAEVSAYGDLPELIQQVKENLTIDKSNAASKTSSPQTQPSATSGKPVAPAKPAGPAKPAAYRPPHAKSAATINAQLFGETKSSEDMSKSALKNKKKREKQREKKALEASGENST